jgi:hypothetical protein
MMKQKTIFLLILLAFCSILIALPGAAVPNGGSLSSTSNLVSDYTASFSWDGTLEETYEYHVADSDKYTMLYRTFNAPLETNYVPNPHVEFLGMVAPDGTVAYLKDNEGAVSFPLGISDANSIAIIQSKALKNEVGIYRASGFEPGTYPVVYNFKFYPPIEYDESAVHLNILLSQMSAAYDHVKIIVPEKSVRKIYFSPSQLTVTKKDNMIIASGSLAENDDLSFEVILEKDTLETLSGFPVYTEDVIGKTEAARDITTVVTQSTPIAVQRTSVAIQNQNPLSSGNWFIDWINSVLHPVTKPIPPYPPVPTVYPAPKIPPYNTLTTVYPTPRITYNRVPTYTIKPVPMYTVKPGPMYTVKPGPMYTVKPGPMYTVKPGPMYTIKPGPMYTMQPIQPYRPPTKY